MPAGVSLNGQRWRWSWLCGTECNTCAWSVYSSVWIPPQIFPAMNPAQQHAPSSTPRNSVLQHWNKPLLIPKPGISKQEKLQLLLNGFQQLERLLLEQRSPPVRGYSLCPTLGMLSLYLLTHFLCIVFTLHPASCIPCLLVVIVGIPPQVQVPTHLAIIFLRTRPYQFIILTETKT